MTGPPPYPDSQGDTRDDTDVGPGSTSTTGAPRWVKVFGIIALVVIALFVIALLGGGGGGHGPARHTSSGATGEGTPAFSVTFSVTGEPAPPEGGH